MWICQERLDLHALEELTMTPAKKIPISGDPKQLRKIRRFAYYFAQSGFGHSGPHLGPLNLSRNFKTVETEFPAEALELSIVGFGLHRSP